MIGEHTVADAAEIRTNVQIYGLFDLLGLKPARFTGGLESPGLRLFPVDLARCLRLLAIHGGRSEDGRIDRAVLGSREGEGLDGVCALIETDVGRGIVNTVRIVGRIHVVGQISSAL